MTPIILHIEKLAFAAPGVEGWPALVNRLNANTEPYAPAPDWSPHNTVLSPRNARRLSTEINLALMVAEELGALSDEDGYVFASSTGEGATLKGILDALRTEQMLIQPIRFQNAVHNAAAGQWSIANRHQGPSTTIAAYDETVGAGLLKAALQVAIERRRVGLVFFDAPLPPPLDAVRPLGLPIGAGMVLSPMRSAQTIGALSLTLAGPGETMTPPRTGVGKALFTCGNPIGQILPLFEQIAIPALAQAPISIALNGGSTLRIERAAP
ncbi:MAG: beta-ketoacyl synthase chain length factor [Neomegalonema sp.]|nr:beta-ketoacyl synthase chain length factor [Neomegalonema sp.]